MNTNSRQSSRTRLDQTNWVMVILIVNLAMFAVSLAVLRPEYGNPAGNSLFDLGSPSNEALYLLGSNHAYRVLDGQWYRVIAAGYLHGSVLHILFNMYFLWQLGPVTQAILGPRRFLTLYIASGIAGSLVSMGWRIYNLSYIPLVELGGAVGASTSMFGILGFLWFWARNTGGAQEWGRQLLMCVVVNLFIGISIPVVDNAGHIGGLIGGILIAFVFVSRKSPALGRLILSKLTSYLLLGLVALSLVWVPLTYFGEFGRTCRALYDIRPTVRFMFSDVEPTASDIKEEIERLKESDALQAGDLPISTNGLREALEVAQEDLRNGWSYNSNRFWRIAQLREFVSEYQHYLGPTSGIGTIR